MSLSHRDAYKQWPHLTEEEFELAGAFFDQRYVQAKLGPTRQIFKIRSRRTLTTGKSHIEVLRLLQLPEDDSDLASAFERLSGGSDEKGEEMEVGEMEVDVEDEVSFAGLLCEGVAYWTLTLMIYRKNFANLPSPSSLVEEKIMHHQNIVFIHSSHM